MEEKTTADEGDEQAAIERRRERRQLIWQLLINLSPTLADVAIDVVQQLF
ncbi:hypothetical protein ABT147_32925 [Streptomyces sp. NPDC001868]